MENGLFFGGNGPNTANDGNSSDFVTALLKNDGQTTYALKGGNAQSGGLTTWWSGALPNLGGYTPMHQEGAIVLGTGGDNSNASVGSFFEGVMTAGYPTDAADNAVQASIVVGRLLRGVQRRHAARGDHHRPGRAVRRRYRRRHRDGRRDGGLWNCQSNAIDQHWTHNSDGSLSTLGRCLDIDGDGTAAGTKVELWDCNGVGGQVWQQQSNGPLLNPQSGLCLDDPSGNTADGTQLQIYTCNGTAAQQFALT